MKGGLADDLYVNATLISMYAAFGDVESAMVVFRTGGCRNQVIWDSMISGLVKNNYPGEALKIFWEMVERQDEVDEITLTSAISACAELRDLEMGRKLHSTINQVTGRRGRNSMVLETALVDMYGKCGVPDMAKKIFDEMPDRNVVTWSAMICGFSQNGHGEEALALFKTMLVEGSTKPNAITLVAALSACGQSGNLSAGKWIHAYVDRSGMEFSMGLHNSIVDMYAKCGNIDLACNAFDRIPEKDLVSFNVIINGLAMHGRGEQALEKFSQMQREGLRPDDVTFIGVLSACSHSGLVEEGLRYHRDMETVYGISPKLEHEGCLVDMLCRAGRFNEAEEFVGEMAGEPNAEVWGALLGGCTVFNELGLGEHATQKLVGEVKPSDDGAYVLLSNMLARRQQWQEARKVRAFMEERGIRKTPGCSSIDVDGVLYEFFCGKSLDGE